MPRPLRRILPAAPRRLVPLLLLTVALAGCAKHEDKNWLGYVEGESALIAPPQAGWIVSLAVARGAHVKIGDVLFTLDTTREAASRESAAAAIAAARAQAAQAAAQTARADSEIAKTRKELLRQQELVRLGASPRRDLEQAQAAYDAARAARAEAEAGRAQAGAQIQEAEANLKGAAFTLGERRVQARIDGDVEDIYFRQGEYANAGTPVLAILPPANVYVRFFVPEEELARLKLGQRVHVGCDGCAANMTAAISFIATQAEFTPPIIYSVANRKKLVFKVEAREPGGLALHPGLPVEISPAP